MVNCPCSKDNLLVLLAVLKIISRHFLPQTKTYFPLLLPRNPELWLILFSDPSWNFFLSQKRHIAHRRRFHWPLCWIVTLGGLNHIRRRLVAIYPDQLVSQPTWVYVWETSSPFCNNCMKHELMKTSTFRWTFCLKSFFFFLFSIIFLLCPPPGIENEQ